jgi:CubicO group peptidase (beta-lactamase class C family)
MAADDSNAFDGWPGGPHDAAMTPPSLDDVLTRAIASERIVGAVVAVAHRGRVVYRGAAGLADREAALPMREDTTFRLASLTKPVVSVVALSLIAQGVLGLDDPITRWLPDVRPRLADGTTPTITVRQLLTHTSGLGYGMFEADGDIAAHERLGVSNGLDAPGRSFDDNARRLAAVPLIAVPGTELHYSLSTDVLGEVLARAAGASLPALVERIVTGPLAMTDTAFVPRDPSRLAVPYGDGAPPVRMADGHVVHFVGGRTAFAPSRALTPGSYPSGGAGLVGTIDDYLHFAEALRTRDRRLLDPDWFAAFTSDQLAGRPSPILGPGWGFGLGVAVLLDPAAAATPALPGTFRWEGAYGHHFWVDPAAELSVVTLTNTAIEGMFGAMATDLRAAVYQRYI